jgi:predicted DNA-binding ribbon-helix-helix protein
MPDQISDSLIVERVQTGVRLEKRLLKVLKALAEHKDMSLGELLEGIVLHSLEGKQPFSRQTLDLIATLRGIYSLEIDAASSHRLKDRKGA